MTKLEIKLLKRLQQTAAAVAAAVAAAYFDYNTVDAIYNNASDEFKSIVDAYNVADSFDKGSELIKQRLEKNND